MIAGNAGRYAVAGALFILGGLGTSAVAEMPESHFHQQIQLGGDLAVDKIRSQNVELVAKAVEGLRKTLPQKIDAATTLVAVDGMGTELTYTFEVDGGPKSDEALRQEGQERMRPAVEAGICRSAKRFLDSGIEIVYRYLSKMSKREILHVKMNQEKCRNLQRSTVR